MRKKIIAFNWKMNPATEKSAKGLLDVILKSEIDYKRNDVIIFPPSIYLDDLLSVVGRRSLVKLGIENVFCSDRGAHTGEISPKMAKNAGAKYTLIGHSERRAEGETDAIISKKIQAALTDGLKVILCVGEPLEIRKKGISSAKKFVANQLKKDLKNLQYLNISVSQYLLVAYEPVWAISTAKDHQDETPEDALEMIKYIKEEFPISPLRRIEASNFQFPTQTPVLYGGSINSKNILDFINHKEIDGVLVGGASVDKKELDKILKLIS